MLSTTVFVGVIAGLLLVFVVMWALLLRRGLSLVKVAGVTMRQVIATTAIVVVLEMGVNGLVALITMVAFAVSPPDAAIRVLGLINWAAAVILACVIISAAFKIGYMKAFLAWLPTLFATFTIIALIVLVVRPYFFESFYLPTNPMAPTLVGTHWEGTCPECGEASYCPPTNARRASSDPPLMICDNFHVTKAESLDTRVHSSDHFMVSKFLEPRRWDMVVFQYPQEPSMLYAMRLVGLPSETIHIEGGYVWVNGERLTPPDSLRGIAYVSEIPGRFGPELWGSPERPASLGEDEYFVLGDFSARSIDSRFWQQGVAGHNPFAVPESHLIGVVTHTFWPPSRWRIHR